MATQPSQEEMVTIDVLKIFVGTKITKGNFMGSDLGTAMGNGIKILLGGFVICMIPIALWALTQMPILMVVIILCLGVGIIANKK